MIEPRVGKSHGVISERLRVMKSDLSELIVMLFFFKKKTTTLQQSTPGVLREDIGW